MRCLVSESFIGFENATFVKLQVSKADIRIITAAWQTADLFF